jgi:Patatin-like phospholipase
MAKQTSSADSSLPLHEVLQAEFVALHGELPSDYPSSGEPETRLKGLWAAIHGLKEKRAALCISGGGIRSATFGLGILQGLARCGLLDKFHYLSTVSGGGYIGSWLSAWIKNQHPEGIDGVVKELNGRSDSALDPEPQPIRHLREFSNYLTPKTGLTSVDFWTLIATFIRNMFLNWLVLISWLAAAMMIPRLCLAAINLQPDWSRLTKLHADYLKDNHLQPDWNTWADSVKQGWDIGLTILLAVGFALIAVAMAYAIIDVPSTGNARRSQRRFLWFRQLPLFLASLIFAEWWALFRNVHGSEPFQPTEWRLKFILFAVASYLSGGLLATIFLLIRKDRHKARPVDIIDRIIEMRNSFLRTGTIVLTAAFAGFCLWAMATKMFLEPPITFTLRRDCEATQISSGQKMTIPDGTQGVIRQFREGNYTAEISQGRVRIAQEHLDALELQKNPRDGFPTPAPAQHALNYVCFAPALILVVLLLVNFLFTGLASWVTKDEDREWWGRSAAWILITIVGWIVFNVMVLWGAQAITAMTGNQLAVFLGQVKANPVAKALLGALGGVTGIAGALLALRSKLSKKLGQKARLEWLLVVVAAVFLVLLSIVISWVLLWLGSQPWVQQATAWVSRWERDPITDPNSWRVQLFVVFFVTGAMLLFGIVMGFLINANTFSLHAIYRNRLIRAYLAASRQAVGLENASHKTCKRHLFTGFDPDDSFELHKLSSEKPLHVLNGTLNLVKVEELAWQERKAESFTMSRLHCGSFRVGYRPSTEYGNDGKGITLGTALAISGAAANPNMGYHSSPVVGFLMTLFNVRLGWWLGNPGPSGAKTWHRSGPLYSVGPLFSEAIGNTTDRYKYVNLSDGGHFENLGLYEMVLRRCHYIVVSDAGEDPECSFADLGEAVRKIRIDFGIPIEFAPMSIYPRSAIDTLKTPGHNGAIGRIRYSVVDGDAAPDGIIIYIKPACYGEEPRDIYEYYKRSATFPHERTGDQFFSESQFESYRMLGAHTMERLCKDCKDCGGDFRRFIRAIFKRHLETYPPDWLVKVFFWESVEDLTKQAGLDITPDGKSALREMINGGVDRIKEEDSLGDDKRKEEAQANLKKFVQGMIQVAKEQRVPALQESTFRKVRDSICPIWPFC